MYDIPFCNPHSDCPDGRPETRGIWELILCTKISQSHHLQEAVSLILLCCLCLCPHCQILNPFQRHWLGNLVKLENLGRNKEIYIFFIHVSLWHMHCTQGSMNLSGSTSLTSRSWTVHFVFLEMFVLTTEPSQCLNFPRALLSCGLSVELKCKWESLKSL